MKSFTRLASQVWRSYLFNRLVAELPDGANSLKPALPKTEPCLPNGPRSQKNDPAASRDLVHSEYQTLSGVL